ncbi:50S ribosomal protein L14e [Candidatus Woesearchaeota archaeon]|nr:50S ribosomal protein L14e [Candidatus Woesearchaeota archaeon]
MIETGRLVAKTAGRDAGKKGLIVDIIDDNYVLVDGQLRRKKCNIKHLELLPSVASIEKGASHEAVSAELKKFGIDVKETAGKKANAETKSEKPRKARAAKGKEQKTAVKTPKKQKNK